MRCNKKKKKSFKATRRKHKPFLVSSESLSQKGFHQAQHPVSTSSSMSILRSIICFSASSASLHPPPMPRSCKPYTWMKTDTNSKACETLGEDCITWEGDCKTHWQMEVFKWHSQLASPHQQQVSPGSQKVLKLVGQMPDANARNIPAGRLVTQLKEEPQWPQTDAGGRGDTKQAHTTLPLSALPASDYFYLSGFPEPSIVSVIHQPSMKLFQLLILSPLKAVNFL